MYIGPDGNPTKDEHRGMARVRSSGIGTGFALAHKKYGSKPWANW